jgi:nitrite reductase (NO-forming)
MRSTHAAAAFCCATLIAGCGPGTPEERTDASGTAADPYDVSRMDLDPPPAVVTRERHDGAFAAGNALSPVDEPLPPLDPAPVKDVRLDTTHKIIEIAPGVRYTAWTFGNQVPGPVIRARAGDRIKFSMSNRTDEQMPGIRLTTAPMMHSMDFHSAMVSPEDKYRSIAPGQTITFEFTPNYPGVYMYHCGTPMVLEHIASGMYGMMIVEPRAGYPTKVDREYAVIQSEFYTMLDPQKREVDGVPLHVLDPKRVRSKAPTFTVFNGRYNGMVDEPIVAKPGERVRLFVLNAGPSNTSSFHVVGTIFDRVWFDGNPDNQFRGMQTVLLGSSGSAIVEFVIPQAGRYVMVDHHFANASQGAVGIIDAEGAGEPEHHNIPATGTPTDPMAARGKLAFELKCLACHSIAGGAKKMGPDLYGVSGRRDAGWLTRWLKDPAGMMQTDPTAKALLGQYEVPMPDQNLSDEEVAELIAYFQWADANVRSAGGQKAPTDGSTKPPGRTLSGPEPGRP